jgi:organic radical activating enzyme
LLPDAHIFIAHQWIIKAIEKLNKLNFKNVYPCLDFLKSIDISKTINSEKTSLYIEPLRLERTIEIANFNYLKVLADLKISSKSNGSISSKSIGSKKFVDTLVVKHIDVVITEQCSMKCRDCSNLMQFYSRPKNSDTNLLFRSMDRLMECVDRLYEFRVIGGDPFMNKEIYKIINKVVKYKNVDSVVIYTNGRIVPKGENLNCLKNKKVRLQITNYSDSQAVLTYPNVAAQHNKVVKVLSSNNIKFVSEKVIKWDDIGTLKFIKETPTQLRNKFMDCCLNDVLSLLDGVLYKCPVSAHATNLKAFSFNAKYDGVDLIDEKINLKNLKKKLIDFYHNNKYVTACSYCKGRGYGEGEVGAAIQTKKALPLFAQS